MWELVQKQHRATQSHDMAVSDARARWEAGEVACMRWDALRTHWSSRVCLNRPLARSHTGAGEQVLSWGPGTGAPEHRWSFRDDRHHFQATAAGLGNVEGCRGSWKVGTVQLSW